MCIHESLTWTDKQGLLVQRWQSLGPSGTFESKRLRTAWSIAASYWNLLAFRCQDVNRHATTTHPNRYFGSVDLLLLELGGKTRLTFSSRTGSIAFTSTTAGMAAILLALTFSVRALASLGSECHLMPGDSDWPDKSAWNRLNQTTGGRLIEGVPLGRPCYVPNFQDGACSALRKQWLDLSQYITDPVGVMSPYWNNASCSPFGGPEGTCDLGNLASYAINVAKTRDVIAGIRFAQKHNVRLTIKNTGHDFLGRSTGAGSLTLWMHNIKNVEFLDYDSDIHAGPAVRVGAGVEFGEVYPAASARGLRVVGGSCSSVGLAGGYTQGGGHSILSSLYGLSADQVLEWEVVTADGNHLKSVSPQNHPGLYWALTGSGTGNYGVVLSVTVKAYKDGPVAGAGFSFSNTGHDGAYWAAVTAWLQHLPDLDAVHGLTTIWSITTKTFALISATLPDCKTTARLDAAFKPVLHSIGKMNVSITKPYESRHQANFAEHYKYWVEPQTYTSNLTLGGRLIPRSAVQASNYTTLPALVRALRDITRGGAKITSVGANVAQANFTSNSVLPAWRDSLFLMTFAYSLPVSATWTLIRNHQAQLNTWQDRLRGFTPKGGAYINEATWDNPHWKQDYYGSNYPKLLKLKRVYDPAGLFWNNAAVGSDVQWRLAHGGRLCRASTEGS
ncbi:hypothetical protein HIM_07841 [Hirsutella minnesotensis 3608]|uniref:FAD-binding PCMH-type domain-containing protein n=1 Tax=Hirsutella minnesotensis 3608 TaxID=1043627 RepID=A0A0F7ZHJ8_9HYPO|nr:hypothetical protein HIM_07841 [Hirsutella minnesotensis 3608]